MANEKRLIDANALEARMGNLCDEFGTDHLFIDAIVYEIGNAPTVDAVEVVHGRWNNRDWGGVSVKGFMACSACNVMIPTTDGNRYCLLKLSYCPNCGCRMDGGTE